MLAWWSSLVARAVSSRKVAGSIPAHVSIIPLHPDNLMLQYFRVSVVCYNAFMLASLIGFGLSGLTQTC